MGVFGGFYKGEKRKKKRQLLEREAEEISRSYPVPRVEIIGKRGKKHS